MIVFNEKMFPIYGVFWGSQAGPSMGEWKYFAKTELDIYNTRKIVFFPVYQAKTMGKVHC